MNPVGSAKEFFIQVTRFLVTYEYSKVCPFVGFPFIVWNTYWSAVGSSTTVYSLPAVQVHGASVACHFESA